MAQIATFYTDEELDRKVDERVEAKFKDFIQQLEHKPKEEEYESKKDTCKRYKVSMPTVDKAIKNGVFPAYRIGARILLKRSEVDAGLKRVMV